MNNKTTDKELMIIRDDLQEIAGILATLSGNSGQSICKTERLEELRTILYNIYIKLPQNERSKELDKWANSKDL